LIDVAFGCNDRLAILFLGAAAVMRRDKSATLFYGQMQVPHVEAGSGALDLPISMRLLRS